MKRIIFTTLVACALMISTVATAQMSPGDILITGNLGAMLTDVEFEQINQKNTGWGLNITVEKVLNNPHWAIGFSLAYLTGTEELKVGSNNETIKMSYDAKPIMLTVRYFFGSKPVMGYFGFGVGSHTSELELDSNVPGPEGNTYRQLTHSGIGLGVPLGVLVHISDNTYFNLNYTPYWTDNDLASDVSHAFFAGLTLAFGS